MKRREAERIALAQAVENGTLDVLVKENINPEYFGVYRKDAVKLWNWSNNLGGVLPSIREVEKSEEYSIKDWEPYTEDVPQALFEIREFHAEDEFNRVLMDMRPALKDKENKGWKQLIKEMPNKLYTIESILENKPAKDFAEHGSERLDYVIERRKQNEKGVWKINFAHNGINDHFGGYEPGFYMYVARTGMGKTWTCLLDLWYSWFKGANVGIFSLEMDVNRVGLRLDTFESHFRAYDLSRGIIRRNEEDLSEEDQEREAEEYRQYLLSLKEMSEKGERGKFRIWTESMFQNGVTPKRIEALVRDEGLDFIVVDQLELVNSDTGLTDERARLNEVSREFKRMAERLEIPILVPHQMNRETLKVKDVTAANVAGSDGPARHAEFVCYLTRDENSNILWYDFLKSRNAPTEKKFALQWDWNVGTYKPIDPYLAGLESYEAAKERDRQAEFDESEEWDD